MLTTSTLSLVGLVPFYAGRFQIVLITEMIIWGLLALSFNLLYGYTGMLSFGQSIFFGTGAYFLTYGLQLGAGLPLTLVLVTVSATVLGFLTGSIVIRVKGARFFLVTLVGAILFHLIALDSRWLTGGDDGLVVSAGFLGIVSNYYLVFAIALGVCFVVLILIRSPIGLVLRMIKDNQRRTELLGYWTDGYKILSFSLAAGIAGLAGGLYGFSTGFVSADFFHWSHSADAVIWTILGGSGTVAGPFIGAALLTFLRGTFSSLLGKVYPVLIGALLVVLMIMSPRGFVGALDRAFSCLRNKWWNRS